MPVLVDASRSMALEDADGARRIDRARASSISDLMPALTRRFTPELLRFGERLVPVDAAALAATDRRTSLGAALQAVRDRYRGRAVAGIVLLSDGGDNGGVDAAVEAAAGAPVYADRHRPAGVAARSRGGRRHGGRIGAERRAGRCRACRPWRTATARRRSSLRLLENGRPVDVRRVTPGGRRRRRSARRSTSRRIATAPTVYTVEIPAAAGRDRRRRTTRAASLVPAAGRPRRVLLVQGAPGFEHSFLRRAWAARPRARGRFGRAKGARRLGRRDVLRAGRAVARRRARSAAIPNTREALFAYDVIVLANVDADLLNGQQLDDDAGVRRRARRRAAGARRARLPAPGAARYGARRRSLPLDVADRTAAIVQAAVSPGENRVALTPAGEEHPVMQLGADAGGEREAMGGRADARVDLPARRAAARRRRAGGHRRARRRAARARRRPALRRRPLDGVHRRGVVALADDAADDRSRPTSGSGGRPRAGSRRARPTPSR